MALLDSVIDRTATAPLNVRTDGKPEQYASGLKVSINDGTSDRLRTPASDQLPVLPPLITS